MAWIGVIVDAVLRVLKAIFGMDKPATTGVTNAKPDKPLDNDPAGDTALLRDLGVQRPEPGTTDKN